MIGRETINIPEIFSGVNGFMGKTVTRAQRLKFITIMYSECRVPFTDIMTKHYGLPTLVN